jgi:hypothetical protein
MKNPFAMFTRAGGNAVRIMVEIAQDLPEADQKKFLVTKMALIARKHPEVYDTMVREMIVAAVRNPNLSIFDISDA